MEGRGYESSGVRGGGQVGAEAAVNKISHSLRGGCLLAVGLQPTLVLQLLLQVHHGEDWRV